MFLPRYVCKFVGIVLNWKMIGVVLRISNNNKMLRINFYDFVFSSYNNRIFMMLRGLLIPSISKIPVDQFFFYESMIFYA